MNALKKFEPTAYAALRIVFGFLFACHGATKVFGVLGGHRPHSVLDWTGAGIELVGGVLILIGLLTPLAAFLASGEMAVAYFMVHQPRGFPADEEWRRAGGDLLLCRAVYRLPRRRQMGRR